MENPRILFIHNRCMPYRKPLFNMLANRHDVCFIFTNEKKVEGLFAEHKVLKRHGLGPINLAFGLVSALSKERYDLIVFPPADLPGGLLDNVICFIVAKIKRKPYLIWSGRWKWKEDNKYPIRRFYTFFDRTLIGFIYRNADACISYGMKHKEYLLSLNVPENKIFIAPQASAAIQDANDDSISKIKEELGLGNKKVILYVGRLIKIKGVNYLIEAFAKVKEELDRACLLIIGEEGLYGKTTEERLSIDKLKLFSEHLGLELNRDIYFLGDIKGANLLRYYLVSDVFVLPGITHIIGEAWGLVLNEAMQFGKPVISTDAVGAAYDLIEDGVNGFMVPERDVDALCKAMSKILSDEKIEQKMGKESKRIISNYSYERMFDGFEKAIYDALNQKGG